MMQHLPKVGTRSNMAAPTSTTPPNAPRAVRSSRASHDVAASTSRICLSLISHTNVGKTTLARTLLRRDVGQVMDEEHVTDISEAYPMLELPTGERLLLWDTPGFGNTASLVKRLQRSSQPIRSFILETWDRFRNRALWCSQQAVRNVQEEADIVLYLVDASQKPSDSAFVPMEMEILQWIGKPVIVLLNQLGPPKLPLAEELDIEEWKLSLRAYPVVRQVLGLDAFARCWVHEHVLLEMITPLLPAARQPLYEALIQAWQLKSRRIFEQSIHLLAQQLAASLCDRVTVSKEGILQKLGVGRKSLNEEMDTAREHLSENLASRSVSSSNELILLHELTGQRREHLEKSRVESFLMPQQVNESLWSAVGGILSGAAVGVATDIKAGGMTFGGGTILGIFAGGAGSYLLAKGYNLTRGGKDFVRWTLEHFIAQVETSLLFYLAVSHWGRGRGDWADADHPPHWRDKVHTVVGNYRKSLERLWSTAGQPDATPELLLPEITQVFTPATLDLLKSLYPQAQDVFTLSD